MTPNKNPPQNNNPPKRKNNQTEERKYPATTRTLTRKSKRRREGKKMKALSLIQDPKRREKRGKGNSKDRPKVKKTPSITILTHYHKEEIWL
jgi:hypothetical protein